jgi:hypothetical protein
MVTYPDNVYKNKPGKRGTHVFVKREKKYRYACVLELVDGEDERLEVVTVFRFREESYIAGYTLLWAGGAPSSSS